MNEKFCYCCKLTKPTAMFNRHSGSKDGFAFECRKCNSGNGAKYRAANREKLKRHSREYAKINPEKIAAYQREWREKNADKIKARKAKYYINNKEKILKRTVENNKTWRITNLESRKKYEFKYRLANKAKLNAYVNHRRCTKQRATPTWADIARISAIYDESARLTTETGIPHHVDHIVPLVSKLVCGLHCEDNLRVMTAAENRSKSNRYWPDMP